MPLSWPKFRPDGTVKRAVEVWLTYSPAFRTKTPVKACARKIVASLGIVTSEDDYPLLQNH